MRAATVLSLSSVLFKSYLRASRRSRMGLGFSQPRSMLIMDVVASVASLVLVRYILTQIPAEMARLIEPVVWQTMAALPIALTSITIMSGILFELGQTTGLSSSEAVNWLPISPREYVAASATSMITVYSPFFAVSVGVTLPLAMGFGLMHVWPAAMILSAVSLFLGAFTVEVLRAAMNKVSTTVYRRSGKLGVAARLVLLVLLFVLVQLAFNPAILYRFLGVIVSGVELVWFIPVIWPSVAIISFARFQTVNAIIFSVLSVIFTFLIFEASSQLRLKYWSPVPISMVIKSAADYLPPTGQAFRFGLSALEAAIALKDFRSLVRRKDMARFIAIPVMLIVSFILPTFIEPGYSARSPGLFLGASVPFMVSLMLSMIAVGQEGKAIVNICMLPISVTEFMKGKLLPAWIISAIATIGMFTVFQILAPIEISVMVAILLASIFMILVGSLIGLGVGSRYPDYATGPRSRYVTFTGFILGFIAGGVSAVVIFAPAALYQLSTKGLLPPPAITLGMALPVTLVIGLTLSYFAYRYCRSGAQALLSSFEA